MMTELPTGYNPEDEEPEGEGAGADDDQEPDRTDTFDKLTGEYQDRALTNLFDSKLPKKELPPDFAEKLKRQVLDEVNQTLGQGGEQAGTRQPTDAEIDAEFYRIMSEGGDTADAEASAAPEQEAPTFRQKVKNLLRRVFFWQK